MKKVGLIGLAGLIITAVGVVGALIAFDSLAMHDVLFEPDTED